MRAATGDPITIVLLGPPGSGKGTQAAKLSAALGIPAISTGEMLRAECASGSVLGRSVKETIESGRLVGDDLMNEVVARRLSHPDCDFGWILDGYPRTASQARFLDGLLRNQGLPKPVVFHMEVEIEEIQRRLAKRLQCPACGSITSMPGDVTSMPVCSNDGTPLRRRPDDCEAQSIAHRFRAYHQSIRDLVARYRSGRYHRIRAVGASEEITKKLMGYLTVRRASTPARHAAVAAMPR